MMKPMNKKADVPETIEWIVASLIIIIILIVYLVLMAFLFPTRGGSMDVRLIKEKTTENIYANTKITINYLSSELNNQEIIEIIQEKGINSKAEVEEHTKTYFKNQEGIWEILMTQGNQKERISNEKLNRDLYGESLCPEKTETINMNFQNINQEKINLKIWMCKEKKEPDIYTDAGP